MTPEIWHDIGVAVCAIVGWEIGNWTVRKRRAWWARRNRTGPCWFCGTELGRLQTECQTCGKPRDRPEQAAAEAEKGYDVDEILARRQKREREQRRADQS